MPLSDEQRQDLRDEEYFRQEVRDSLSKAPKTLLGRCSAFLETKAGFWLLTTVLAGAVATGYAKLQQYLDRSTTEQRERGERARRDTELLVKLGPMLTSAKMTEVNVALVLLDGLAREKGVDPTTLAQVHTLVAYAPNDAKAAFVDQARRQQNQSGTREAASTPVSGGIADAIDDRSLPVRVYLQIGSEAQRPTALQAGDALRKSGLLVPDIELVPLGSVPRQNDLRYCESKADAGAVERVRIAVSTAIRPEPRVVILPSSLCSKVRFNSFEVWYAAAGSQSQ